MATPPRPPVLEVRGVSKRLGSMPLLEGVSFSLDGGPQGEVVALVGPSGIGKTQLLRIIAGLEQPDAGQVICSGASTEPGRVGLVAQTHPLFNHRTVLGNLLVAGRASRMDRAVAHRRALGLIGRVRLSGRLNNYPAQLSGGEHQRVAIVQQLMTGKDVLLLDEPFSGLDRAALREVAGLVRELLKAGEVRVVIVVTHDIRSALLIADRVFLLGRSPDVHAGATVRAVYDCRLFGPSSDPDRDMHPVFREAEREIEGYFTAHWQVHARFKVFSGTMGADGRFVAVAREVERFAAGVAAKSIGAERLPAVNRVLVTLGYRDDEMPYGVRLSWVMLADVDPAYVEETLCREAERQGGVICHDVYEAAPGRAALLLMTLARG